jgi:hypothetical protein
MSFKQETALLKKSWRAVPDNVRCRMAAERKNVQASLIVEI